MITPAHKLYKTFSLLLALGLLISGCGTERPKYIISASTQTAEEPLPTATPFNERPVYAPGTLVDYVAQSGDTLPILASRFGTTPQEILFSNPDIPKDITTLPPGYSMKMPIYYKPLWGTDFQIIPDSAFVYGPDVVDFDLPAFLDLTPGWFKHYKVQIQEKNRDAAGMINYYAENYSINPKLLIALIEYQTGALSNPQRDASREAAFLGFENDHEGVSLQVSFVAELLNDGFYRYQMGELTSITHLSGVLENIDPWQNPATVALQHYFALFLDGEDYLRAIGPDGLAKTFRALFGDPWQRNTTVIPGGLTQPRFILPFSPGTVWAYTGGPHTGWGELKPYAAIDFAPPLPTQGCVETEQYALAVADGIVARTDPGTVILDLDGDGDERTGWTILYLHIAAEGRVRVGTVVKQGDRIGHPSCEGGIATGTHVHLARRYNGQWISAADQVLPFNLEGWIPVEGTAPYLGTLVRGNDVVTASTKSGPESMVPAD